MKKIDPIGVEEFKSSMQSTYFTSHDYKSYYAETIKNIQNFAIGPFYWVIANNFDLKGNAYSDSIAEFTPYTKEQWLVSNTLDFYTNQLHEEDRFYVLSAFAFVTNLYLDMPPDYRKNIKINIYGRMLNKEKKFRWVLIQIPNFYINENNEVIDSICVHYDLSHLSISSMPLISVIDYQNNEVKYFKHINQEVKKVEVTLPILTKRELEVLKLIAQGLNTPEISEKLFISYHTVQNHKRNLRKKTNCKTSSELIAFTMKYNLLLL